MNAQAALQPYIQRWSSGLGRAMQRNQITYATLKAIRGPQVLTFRCGIDEGKLGKVLGMSEELALAMGVQSVRVARNLGFVDFEVSLPDDLRRSLPIRALKQPGGTRVAIGQTSTGRPVRIDLAGNRSAHVLISGTTGSGKTVTEWVLAWALASGNEPRDIRLILIDGKGGVKWRGFDNEAHLAHPIIGDPQDALAALAWVLAEMEERKQSGRSKPTVIVSIDETHEIMTLGGDKAANALDRITRMGRELGIHIIAATQYPTVDAVGGGGAKANFPVKLIGMAASATAGVVAGDVDARSLQGNGDFLLQSAAGTYRVQIAHIGERQLYQLPRTDQVPTLDFGSLDLDHVLNVAIGIEPEQVAVALIDNKTIRELKAALHIGQAKAALIRVFSDRLLSALRGRGYDIYPIQTQPLAGRV